MLGFTKAEAERIVCGANGQGFRTGVIRPGNPVYGQRNDLLVGNILSQGKIVSWIGHVIQNVVSGRNIALAHLQLEAALTRPEPPRCAGRPFVISDPNPPPSHLDIHNVCMETAATPFSVTEVPPILMLVLAHLMEGWCLLLAKLPFLTRNFGWAEPRDPIQQLQPAVFALASHHIIDDSAARRSIENGGLGYTGACTSLEGICEQIVNWNREHEQADVSPVRRSDSSGTSMSEKLGSAGLMAEAVHG